MLDFHLAHRCGSLVMIALGYEHDIGVVRVACEA